jgi:hypothetical protein
LPGGKTKFLYGLARDNQYVYMLQQHLEVPAMGGEQSGSGGIGSLGKLLVEFVCTEKDGHNRRRRLIEARASRPICRAASSTPRSTMLCSNAARPRIDRMGIHGRSSCQ